MIWSSKHKTRMHSSGMRTTHFLTVSCSIHRGMGGCIPACTGQGGVCPGGVYLGIVCLPGGALFARGVCPGECLPLVPGCVADTPRDQRQTPLPLPPLWTDRHLWKHNLRKLRLRPVKTDSSIWSCPFVVIVVRTASMCLAAELFVWCRNVCQVVRTSNSFDKIHSCFFFFFADH